MKLYTLALILILFFCDPLYAVDISFESDVSVKATDKDQFEKISAGQLLQTEKNSSYYIVNSKNIPLLLITAQNSNSKIQITDQDFTKIFDEKTTSLIEQKTNSIINDIRKAESLLIKKEFSQALAVINQSKEKHKNVSAILFLSGSLHSLMNNKKMALEDLEKGLQLDPQNVSALGMIKKLKGLQ